MPHFLVYVRRSYRQSGDADVSDEAQVEASLAMLPPGATHEVIADSGGHHSGRTDRRDGLRDLVARIEARRCDGLAVYDVSRLARNARLLLELHAAVERAGIPLLVANVPNTRWDTAVGRFLLTQLAAAAQFQADMDSERARGIRRALYEDGRHRGHPPFGYRSGRDETNRRVLVVVPEHAEVVRRIFAELATSSFAEVAEILTAEGAPAPVAHNGWTRYSVREVYQRARVYLGMVVSGVDERPGRHEPLVTPELVRAAVAGLRGRDRGGRKAGPGRTYLLTGLVECDCKRTMTGSIANRRPVRYYLCRYCRRPMVRADEIEAKVLDAVGSYRLTARSIALAREELLQRLAGPRSDATAAQRRRLEGRLVNLRKQHAWGDIDDATYRRERAETEGMIAVLPDEDKLVAFDRYSARVLDMADAIADMTPDERKQAIRLFVEAVTPDGRIRWTPQVRPFYALAVGVEMVSPEGLEPSTR